MASVAISQRFYAPIEEVFEVVSAHEMLAEVLPLLAIEVKKYSADGNSGLGSVRAMGVKLCKPLREEVTLYEPPYRLEYKVVGVLSKLLTHHHGVLIFNEDSNQGNHTLVIWHIELKTKPAFLSGLVLTGLKKAIKIGLAKKAKQLR